MAVRSAPARGSPPSNRDRGQRLAPPYLGSSAGLTSFKSG
jgi:hypothetical protein